MTEVQRLIDKERIRQRQLHGDHFIGGVLTSDRDRYVILGEEVGEVARAISSGNLDAIREELVHVAASAISWLESLEG